MRESRSYQAQSSILKSGRTAHRFARHVIHWLPLIAACLPLLPLAANSARAQLEPQPIAAILKTDPELEYRLRRADEMAAMGEYVEVIPLWQSALDTASDIVVSRDGHLYQPVARQIEETICSLPPQALRAYRLTADGESAALFAVAGKLQEREAALAEIVQRFFLSTYGDEAAYELACRALDRHDFVNASHLLLKILDDYPEPTVDRTQVLLRLAVAQSRLGDRTEAAEKLNELLALRPAAADDRLVQSIAREIEEVPDYSAGLALPGVWRMRLGTLAGNGTLPPPPAELLKDELVELWHHDFRTGSAVSPGVPLPESWLQIEAMPHAMFPRKGAEALREDITRWQALDQHTHNRNHQQQSIAGGHASGQILFDHDRLYFKTPAGLVCADAFTGRVLWRGKPSSFAADLRSEYYSQYLRAYGNSGIPFLDRLQLYRDRVNQGMALSDGQIFNIEGHSEKHEIHFHQYNQIGLSRTRYNWLTAYDALTGKILWQYPGGNDFYRSNRDASFYRLGFLGPPVPFARVLLAPVCEHDSLWLYAIDRNSGELVWKAFLCEELPSVSDPWSPVGLAVEGGEVYVSTGASAVIALDARTGAVRWAYHYETVPTYDDNRAWRYVDSGYFQQTNKWEEDIVITHGRALIAMASDSDKIQARDRRDGSLLWESPNATGEIAATYCLGVLDDRLYVAGPQVVRCIAIVSENGDTTNGRIEWETIFKPESTGISYGRGALTPEGIYLPVRDKVVRLDPQTGEILDRVTVQPPEDIAVDDELEFVPVGNLYSDGRWLHVVSPGRVSALGTAAMRQKVWGSPPEMPTDEISTGGAAAAEERSDAEPAVAAVSPKPANDAPNAEAPARDRSGKARASRLQN